VTNPTHRPSSVTKDAPSYETTALRHKSRHLGRVLQSLFDKYWATDGHGLLLAQPKVQFERTSLDQKQVEVCRRCLLRVAPTLSAVQQNALLVNLVLLATEGEEVVLTLGDRMGLEGGDAAHADLPAMERLVVSLENYVLSRQRHQTDPTNAVLKWCRNAKRVRRYQSYRQDPRWQNGAGDEDDPMLLHAMGGVGGRVPQRNFQNGDGRNGGGAAVNASQRRTYEANGRLLSKTAPQRTMAPRFPPDPREEMSATMPENASGTTTAKSSRRNNRVQPPKQRLQDPGGGRTATSQGGGRGKANPKSSSAARGGSARKPKKQHRGPGDLQARVTEEISQLERALLRHEVQLNKMQSDPQSRLQQMSQKLDEDTPATTKGGQRRGGPAAATAHDFEYGRIRPQKKSGKKNARSAREATSDPKKRAREKELAASLMQTLAAGGGRSGAGATIAVSILPVGEEFAHLPGGAIGLEISPLAGVLDLKAEVCAATGIEAEEQILLFRGQRLDDDATLEECKIEADAQIRLVVGKAIQYSGASALSARGGAGAGGTGPLRQAQDKRKSALRVENRAYEPKEPVRFSNASPEVRTRPRTPWEDVRDMFWMEEELNNFREEAERESMENALYDDYDGNYEYQVEESGTFLRDLQEYDRQPFYQLDEVDDENSSNLAEEGSQNLDGLEMRSGPSIFEGGMSTEGGGMFEGDGEEYDSDGSLF
jgi:hypothetical protein